MSYYKPCILGVPPWLWKPPYVPRSKHGIWFVVIHPTTGESWKNGHLNPCQWLDDHPPRETKPCNLTIAHITEVGKCRLFFGVLDITQPNIWIDIPFFCWVVFHNNGTSRNFLGETRCSIKPCRSWSCLEGMPWKIRPSEMDENLTHPRHDETDTSKPQWIGFHGKIETRNHGVFTTRGFPYSLYIFLISSTSITAVSKKNKFCAWTDAHSYRKRGTNLVGIQLLYNVNPGLINPGWLIVVVPPNSDITYDTEMVPPPIKQPIGVY